MDSEEYMLTTVDNPFNPFTNFRAWQAYDHAQGYYSSEFLARVVWTSEELSEHDQRLAIQNGIDEIVRENVSGMHKKIKRDEVPVVATPSES